MSRFRSLCSLDLAEYSDRLLVDQHGRFLIEQYLITFLSSGRDLGWRWRAPTGLTAATESSLRSKETATRVPIRTSWSPLRITWAPQLFRPPSSSRWLRPPATAKSCAESPWRRGQAT